MAICFLSLFVTVVFHGPRAYGWGDLGHEVVGAIAEGALKPATHNFVRGILGVEPLAVAATWPDHARGDSRFGQKATSPDSEDNNPHNFANYHFCEIPNGFSYTSKPMREKKDCYGAITGATQLLIDKSHQYTRAEKMIALRYLVHIIGDVHQPLHVGNGHDLGANLCQILLWDDLSKPPKVRKNRTFTTMICCLDCEKTIPKCSLRMQSRNLELGHPSIGSTNLKPFVKAAFIQIVSAQ
jgi:hypothetical protein